MKKVIIYSKQTCGHCKNAKKLLESLGIIYEDRPVGTRYTSDQAKRHCLSLNEKANVTTVPQMIMVNDGIETYIGGYSELSAMKDQL